MTKENHEAVARYRALQPNLYRVVKRCELWQQFDDAGVLLLNVSIVLASIDDPDRELSMTFYGARELRITQPFGKVLAAGPFVIEPPDLEREGLGMGYRVFDSEEDFIFLRCNDFDAKVEESSTMFNVKALLRELA